MATSDCQHGFNAIGMFLENTAIKQLGLWMLNSGNFQDWKLSMGINGNKPEVCKIAGTGNLTVVENKILQHDLG